MSVRSEAKSQTELYDQKASATEHWLLGNGLNSRETGEKPTVEQKSNTFSSSVLSFKYPPRV